MQSIYDLKPKFQQLLRPLTAALHRAGISANTVTLTAMFASMLYGTWMSIAPQSHAPFLMLPLFMLARMALNAIDGMLAREYRQQTRLGAILNEVGDLMSDAALYAPFALFAGVSAAIVALFVFLSLLTEFVGVLGQIVGGGRRYDGPLGKSDRAFLFGTIGLLIGLAMPIQPYLNALFGAACILLVWTAINRTYQALRHAQA